MENKAHALAAGLFALVLGAALVAAGLWFRKDDMRLTHYLVSTTRSVTGLRDEAAVSYRGVHVGRVESIKIEPGGAGRINVLIGVQEGTPITKSTYAQLGYQGVTGLAYISLNDDGSSSEPLKAEGQEPPRIELRPSVFDSGPDLVAAINELAGRMNEVLNDENRKLLKTALAGIGEASLQTASLAEGLRSDTQGIPALVGDARSALVGVESLTASLKERAAAFDRMAASLDEVGVAARSFGDETVPRFNALVEQLSRDTRALDRVFSALDENPQSFVFGAPRGRPGPGEPGFKDGAR